LEFAFWDLEFTSEGGSFIEIEILEILEAEVRRPHWNLEFGIWNFHFKGMGN
jgi:hypothetical protein